VTATAAAGATIAAVPGLSNGTSYTFTVHGANAYGTGPDSLPSNAVTPAPPPGSWPGRLHPLTPARVLDTRSGFGAGSAVGPGATVDVPVLGRGGVPAGGVSAVVLNVTATDATQGGYLSLAAGGGCVVGSSNLNFAPGQQVANLAVVPVGAGGAISVYNSAGSVDVIADVQGWIGGAADTGPDGHFQPVTPTRLLDTRQATQGIGTLGAGRTVTVSVAGQQGLPTSGVSAVALNLTSTNASRASYLSVWPAGQARPPTSNVNFAPWQTVANRVVVPLGSGGAIQLYNSEGSADAIVDVTGWYSDAGGVPGGLYTAVTPVRALDTRFGVGAAQGRLGAGAWLTAPIAGRPGLPASGISAAIVNVTATNVSQATFLEVNQTGAFTGTSDLNLGPGGTGANLVIVPVDASGAIHVFNAAGAADVLVDVLGWY